MPVSEHELIFKRWEASLATRDLSWGYVQGNFEELFNSLQERGLGPADAFEYVARAAKAHNPPSSLIKFKYKQTKSTNPRVGTLQEFQESWIMGIAKKANVAFFNVYPQHVSKKLPIEVAVLQGNPVLEQIEFEAEADSLTLE